MSQERHRWMGKGTGQRGMFGSIGSGYMFAGDHGFGDTEGPSHVETQQNIQSRAWIQAPLANTYGVGKGLEAGIGMSHYALAVVPRGNECWADWDIPLTGKYSFRLILQFDGNVVLLGAADGDSLGAIYGYEGNVEKWRWELRPEEVVFENFAFVDKGRQSRLRDSYRIANGVGGTIVTPWTSYSLGGQPPSFATVRARIEGKVDNGVLTLNVYENFANQTDVQRDTIRSSQSITLASPNINNFAIGTRPASSSLRPVWVWSAIQIWDDTTDPDPWPRGQYVTSPPTWERVVSPGVTEPMHVVGQVTNTSPFTVTTKTNADFAYYGEKREVGYDLYKNLAYHTSGSVQFQLDLYVPNEEFFPGPHPVVLWAHSGFFTGGSKEAIPADWVKALTNAGYAVASMMYPLCSNPALGTYPDFPGKVEHPVQIAYYKRAMWWLKTNAATYNLDPNKLINSGYSAGSYLAMAAGLSRGLGVVNGYNLAMTATFADGIADPTCQGIFTYAGPVTWSRIIAEDPTGFIGQITPRAYMGKGTGEASGSQDADITDYITASSYKPPLVYVRGNQDPLIGPGNATDLKGAYNANGAFNCTTHEIISHHDNIDTVNDPNDPVNGIIPWMNNLFGGAPTRVDP